MFVGRDEAVGIATYCGLEGPRSEPVGMIFSTPVQTDPGNHTDSREIGTDSLSQVKQPERDLDHPPNLLPRFKKE